MRYVVSESQQEDAHARSLRVWLRNFANPDDFIQRYAWFYKNHPYDVYSFLLTDPAGNDVGAAGLSERRFNVDGQVRDIGLCSDFSVDVSARFLMPAMKLQKEVLRTGLSRFAFIYGFPNPRAIPVMRRAGYHPLGPFTSYVIALRSGYYLRRYLPATASHRFGAALDTVLHAGLRWRLRSADGDGRLDELAGFDARFDALWARAQKAPVMGVRDQAFLTWRYARDPLHRHRVFGYFCQGELTGYAVIHADGDRHWHMLDFFVNRPQFLPTLLAELVRFALREGAVSLRTEFFGYPRVHGVLRQTGLRTRPSYRCIMVGASEGVRRELLPASAAGWYLTSGDED